LENGQVVQVVPDPDIHPPIATCRIKIVALVRQSEVRKRSAFRVVVNELMNEVLFFIFFIFFKYFENSLKYSNVIILFSYDTL